MHRKIVEELCLHGCCTAVPDVALILRIVTQFTDA